MQQRVRKRYRGKIPSSSGQLPVPVALNAELPTLFGDIIHDFAPFVNTFFRRDSHFLSNPQSPAAFPKLAIYRAESILAPPLGVSEAQSAEVNDSPVGCQSRRPGCPQATVKNLRFLTERALSAQNRRFWAPLPKGEARPPAALKRTIN